MKYLALWLGIAAAMTLAIGLVAVAAYGLFWIASQPDLWWIPGIFIVSALVATIAVAYDYLTEKRPPKP